ncbi:methionine aminopeptidase 1D, mitochondrial [Tribolium castaneum]|uniref:methionine aminopeptidase 1D, mitochondrial n=1 Tax=Tribolium castaneum TaxID=7070 RepID=UPI00046BF497|nr:PREDICTED: methionine aminopeptidase 1D, mitochondrial [Tribolium castaneum]|eukprot:XP_008195219.1 PREDICTED: methionine aminopeptidase 1D, mitochondrial [Tribolium castaneum]
MFSKSILKSLSSKQLFFLKNLWSKKKLEHGKFNIVEPGNVSPQKTVPDHIVKPSYYATGHPTEFIDHPEIKNLEQIENIRESCKLAANILKKVEYFVKVGVTTDEVDSFTHDLIISKGAYPSPLNYKKFPKSVCTSVNNVACHGIPDDRKLEDGDIINVDITVFYNGYHGDCSKTFLVGNVDDLGKELVKATETCLKEGISICKPGVKFCKVGEKIEHKAKSLGFTVVPAFIGHGIGHYFHGPPDIYHLSNDYPGVMKAGMTFTIEPVLSTGSEEIVILDDGWTAVTLDFSRTAQFEHTVLISETGVEILTM